jgi:DeoR/GlpR family transcriptional regulator of sugar metabolism
MYGEERNMQRQAHPSILPAERQRRILEAIRSGGGVTVEGLVSHLGVSEATVRRDLEALSAKGLVSRTHGGAVSPGTSTAFEDSYAEKQFKNLEEKCRIGAVAAALAADGEAIALDAGSTTLEVARRLINLRHLTVMTYDLLIAGTVDYNPTSSVLLAGGRVRRGFGLTLGSETERFFRRVRVNKAFLGADAIDPDRGIFNANFEEAAVKQLLIESACEVIVVADRSKFGKTALVEICGMERITRIVTDRGADPAALDALRRNGVAVTLA